MTSPILIFINPLSGSGLAGLFMESASNFENIYFVKLPEDVENWTETHSFLLQQENLRIICAGGDGTVNWTISLLSKIFSLEETGFRPPIAICPFGTGNDLSRSLGWGPGMTEYDLNNITDFLDRVKNSQYLENVDIWEVEVNRHDTEEINKFQMLNYFSIGVDAAMANDFEWVRRNCSWLFCCQCISRALYFPVGTWNCCGNTTLDEYFSGEIEDSSFEGTIFRQEIPINSFDRTFVVQAIPSIYGGRDLWQIETPRAMNDKKLEITLQGGSVLLGLTHLGVYLGRTVGQATKVITHTSQPCFYQIDGEGKISNGPSTFIINRIGSYPLLFNRN